MSRLLLPPRRATVALAQFVTLGSPGSFAVTLMTTAELAALSDRCSVTFAGRWPQMPKITAKDLNRIHAEYAADPAGQEETFWSAVHNYVGRCCYSVPAEFKSDLVQDIVLEVMAHISRFRPGTNFQKWLSAVIRNLRADSFRVNLYEVREVPFSQLGAWDDDGGYAEFEPSTLDCTAWTTRTRESTRSSSSGSLPARPASSRPCQFEEAGRPPAL